jgi:hypothetical protein
VAAVSDAAKEHARQHNVERHQRRVAHHAERTAEAKRQRGDACEDCGGTDQLEFDHIDPSTKIRNISTLNTASDERFWVEVTKCRLLCRPCHVAKTTAQGEWNRQPTAEHGRWTYDSKGCRCDTCCEAKRAANAKRYINKGETS